MRKERDERREKGRNNDKREAVDENQSENREAEDKGARNKDGGMKSRSLSLALLSCSTSF